MFALLRGFEVKFELSYVPVGGYVYLACYGTHASVTSTRSLVWQRGAMTCFNGSSLPITLSTRCSKLDSLEDKVQLFAHYIYFPRGIYNVYVMYPIYAVAGTIQLASALSAPWSSVG